MLYITANVWRLGTCKQQKSINIFYFLSFLLAAFEDFTISIAAIYEHCI